MNKVPDLSSLGLPPLPSSSAETVGALLWSREVVQQYITALYAVDDPKGIEELKPVKIGGVDQWLQIRGNNHDNPVLLYLHGGPGSPMIGLMDGYFRSWEDYFTVVFWDQRQTGKSYYPANDEEAPLSIEQFLSDTEEVIQYLQNHLNQEKLFLLGHSWGSMLGMHMVKKHPDWLHAYIGIGQVVNVMDNERLLYEKLLGHAQELQQNELIEKLESIAPYPNPQCPVNSFVENYDWLRRDLSRLSGGATMHHRCVDDAAKVYKLARLLSPHLTLTDLSNLTLGDKIAVERPPYDFTKEFLAIDLPNDVGSSFEVPIFFFTGAHDYQTPVSLSDQWFSQINAPYKELLHFEESAHIIVNEEPGKLLVALVNKVLPFAKDEGELKGQKHL